jgi:hypothetical protein
MTSFNSHSKNLFFQKYVYRIQGSKLPVIRTPRGTDFVHRAPAPHEP